ncbi:MULTISPECIES: DUF4232 domain-containing protein [Streptomyces]|uniref:DUF4232 domain-containing protein n=2 Tax=Streptomyces TaxID=1883 RepID=A0A2N8P6A5_STRNR|nr:MULTISPECIES: DUF4232 domain-containing protein [Streptomyces]AJC57335.1 hypothetical protein GZL_04757 [Streptomyces sp. 769]PNE36539.1 hypothetical protein AOB60_41535 [Streptomyces noursei]WEB41652.1 DUF4232 domain-containing protein [Streptomyces yunnanensis]
MTARRTRRRSAAYAALALGLAGSLALTGCNSTSSKSKKSSSSSSSKSKKRKIIGGAAAGAGAGAVAGRHVSNCNLTTARLQFSQQARPKGYVTVRYQNSSSTLSCTLYNAPLLSFNQAKTPLPMVKPDSGHLVTLRPHNTAYAVIPTTTPAALGTTQKNVAVQFMGRSEGSRTTESPVTYDFAEKRTTISVGQSKVTNWYSSLSAAKLEAGVG